MLYIPTRIQRRRTKGWRMPPNTLNCTRGSKYGNPFRVGDRLTAAQVPEWFPIDADGLTAPISVEEAVEAYKIALYRGELPYSFEEAQRELRRHKYAACWCAEDAPCHVNVLVGVAGACDWCKPRYSWHTFVCTFEDADTGETLAEHIICQHCWDRWMEKVNAYGSGLGRVELLSA